MRNLWNHPKLWLEKIIVKQSANNFSFVSPFFRFTKNQSVSQKVFETSKIISSTFYIISFPLLLQKLLNQLFLDKTYVKLISECCKIKIIFTHFMFFCIVAVTILLQVTQYSSQTWKSIGKIGQPICSILSLYLVGDFIEFEVGKNDVRDTEINNEKERKDPK